MEDGRHRSTAIVREIRNYLLAHPNAADTAEGIGRWLPQQEGAGPDDVRAALDTLVAEGSLVAVHGSSGDVVYRSAPVTVSYPGVYVQEIPSAIHPIAGVPTSITAFVGRALRGPTDRPQRVQSFTEYSRTYGGLWRDSLMSYAVQQYFENGGRDALVARVHHGAQPATVVLAGGLVLVAANEGTWGNSLRVRIDHHTRPADPGELATSLFNLAIKDVKTGVVEHFSDLSTDPTKPRFVGKVLEQQSNLVRVSGAVPVMRPNESGVPPIGKDPLEDPASSTGFAATGADGKALADDDLSNPALEAAKRGLWLLEHAELFNILCIPPLTRELEVGKATWDAAVNLVERRRAFLLVDAPGAWTDPVHVTAPNAIDGIVTRSASAAMYFPRVRIPDPENENRLESFAPCGVVAGNYARADSARGVWKAPAGFDATLLGVVDLTANVTDGGNGQLNPLGVNCLRTFRVGRLVWGARTLKGADELASEWKYVPVRRLALYIEESLYRGTQWALFEPNDEPLWASIRLNVGAFLETLFREGAFQGRSPKDAYFVKCDGETTTQADIDVGIVNIVVGFAPLRPAEFVVTTIQQTAQVNP